MMKSSAAALGLVCVLQATPLRAQDCECDHTVPTDTLSINGGEMGVQPGDVICIESGEREFLRIYEMVGTEADPITIKNCGGQVVIRNTERGYGLTVSSSEHLHLTGTGDDEVMYGFNVSATRDGPDYSASCIVMAEMSTDYELDHIEAFGCGFAGVSAKTDPTCEARDLSDFVQRNSHLHHLYLHDTGGEGIYFGSTGYPSRTRNCDGADVELIPHTHEGVWIHDNVIEDTGWDGAQVGVSPRDCFIYRNRIARVGLAMEQYQMQGLQIGGASSCEVFDNFITDGPAVGIIVLDAADTRIHNNVVTNFLDGIYLNDRDNENVAGASYRVIFNTIVGIEDRAIGAFGSRTANNVFANNLVVDGGATPLSIGSEVDATVDGNLLLDTVAEALFADADAGDYTLLDGAPAIDAGVDASAWEITVDQTGAARDASPDAGAFEYGAPPPEEPNEPPGPGTAPPEDGEEPGTGKDPGDGKDAGDGSVGGGPEGSDEDSGCSCRSAGGASRNGSIPLALLVLVGAAASRRRRTAA